MMVQISVFCTYIDSLWSFIADMRYQDLRKADFAKLQPFAGCRRKVPVPIAERFERFIFDLSLVFAVTVNSLGFHLRQPAWRNCTQLR